MAWQADTRVQEVISTPAFGDFGRLIFPVEEGYYSGDTLGDLRLTWYSGIDPDKTVEIVNYMHDQAAVGNVIFYDIYSDEEKAEDPAKRDTGLFFFRGKPDAKFAVCNAGGGFAYVGAMHDSFPHALELSKRGYNAFALIYRPGAQTACEDLARAISFIFAVGRFGGRPDGSVPGDLWPRVFWRRRSPAARHSGDAVYRAHRLLTKRPAHLCLHWGKRRHCQPPDDAPAAGCPGCAGNTGGIPCL